MFARAGSFFEKSSYSCTAGKTITTYISAYRYNGGATVKSYSSSDKTIATIDDKVTSQPTCAGCAGVRIVCKKKGTITLTAKSSTGAKGTATVKVK